MLICPKCNCEYQDWCNTCSDCQCELVEWPKVKEENLTNKFDTKLKKSIISVIIIICLFLCGNLISFIGLTKGVDIAGSLCKPKGAMGWTIPDSLILACTYVPVIIGVSLIILSISLSTVLFVNWINNNQ